MTQYAVARAYSPLLVSGYVNGSVATVALTSDVNANLSVDVTVEVLRWAAAAAAPGVAARVAARETRALGPLGSEIVLATPLEVII